MSRKGLSLIHSKNGQFVQLGIFLVVIFVLALIFMFSNWAGSSINDFIQASPDMSTESKVVMQDNTDSQPLVFDAGGVFIVVILWLVLLGLAYKGADNPFMAIAAIVIIVALGFVGMIFSNAWEGFANNSDTSTAVSNFTMLGFFMQHYLVIVILFGFSSLIVYLYRLGGVG